MTAISLTDSPQRPRTRRRGGDVTAVDLWLAAVDGPADDARVAWLDEAEWARAQRFSFDRDRTRFVNRRAFMREVLARYLDSEPSLVNLHSTKAGRPELDLGTGLDVNASHSDGVAVVAVTHGQRVGVDIERMRAIDDATDLATGLFRPAEMESMRSTPELRRSRAFLTLWTRKESFAKATGQGLALPLDRFDMLTAEGGVGRPSGPQGDLPYVFADFEPSPGFVGAVTVGDTSAPPRLTLMVSS